MITHGKVQDLVASSGPRVARHSHCECSLDRSAGVNWKCCLLAQTPALRATVSQIREFFRALVGAFQGRKGLVSGRAVELVGCDKALTWKATSERALLALAASPALALITPSSEWRISDARDRRRRSDEEMVPYGPASLGAKAICLQSLQSGLQRSP